VSASFPNWEGEAQTRVIDKLTADEFVNTNPNVAGGPRRRSYFTAVKIAGAAAASATFGLVVDELVGGELVDDAGLRLAFPIRE